MSEDGSTFKVPFTKILAVNEHTNAHSLELYTVFGWQVIARKGSFKVGDSVIYIPIDSILPADLEAAIFGPDSKVKLHKSRVRQIRLRGLASQGMLVSVDTVAHFLGMDRVRRLGTYEENENLAEELGIKKYEPPVKGDSSPKAKNPRNKPLENSRFHKYNGVNNIKWFPNFFRDEEVVIQEKIHGSCCRAFYGKTEANTLWKKLLKFIGFLPKYEYCYGSNNVQLQERKSYTGFYGEDVYGAVLRKVDAFNKLKPGETIYGELIGPGIQNNYTYGHTEHHFVLYDVKREREDGSQEFLDPEEAEAFAKERGFDFVPVLYRGIMHQGKAYDLTSGPSVYCPDQKVREGIVIKARTGYGVNGSKRALKWLNEVYLDDKSNSDFH